MEKESHRFQLGSVACTILLDGTFAYPHPAQVLFAGAPEGDLKEVLAKHGLDPVGWEQYLSPYPTLLIESGGRRILVDTGAGSLAPTTGKLLPRLQSLGIAPQSIDSVVLTHAHPIHVERPQWVSAVDLLPEQSIDTRLRLLGRAADERALVLSFHFPFPGLGRVVREKDGFRWQPV